jgi:SAM-dependent methyltransferase
MLAPVLSIRALKPVCPRCRAPLPQADGPSACAGCGLKYEVDGRYLRYEFDSLLFKRFRREYLLNKVLNNNGLIAYQLLKEGSLSLPDRADVRRFRDFLAAHARPGTLLDVGCGVLEMPGYLEFPGAGDYQLIGLDPIDDRAFRGLRIVGCSEFIPLPDASVDTIVFATSLDHVCSLAATLAEVHRILKPGGKVVIWMGDRSTSIFGRGLLMLKTLVRNIRKGYRTDRYWVYPDGTVLGVPCGAVDPFHSYHEDPKWISRKFTARGFRLEAHTATGADEVFLSFCKPTRAAADDSL